MTVESTGMAPNQTVQVETSYNSMGYIQTSFLHVLDRGMMVVTEVVEYRLSLVEVASL